TPHSTHADVTTSPLHLTKMSVNRIKARIIVENQRAGTTNLRGDGPSEAVIPAIRNCCTSDQIVPIGTSLMFSSKLVMGPWRTTGKEKVNADLLSFIPN
ncbi:MAG: hypothetical protein WBE32_10300, partial [Pseudolabrys sp.]